MHSRRSGTPCMACSGCAACISCTLYSTVAGAGSRPQWGPGGLKGGGIWAGRSLEPAVWSWSGYHLFRILKEGSRCSGAAFQFLRLGQKLPLSPLSLCHALTRQGRRRPVAALFASLNTINRSDKKRWPWLCWSNFLWQHGNVYMMVLLTCGCV